MKYATHNENVDRSAVYGTSLKGYIECDYETLVAVFGEPTTADGYKVDCEWIVEDRDKGTVATIYNWKNGKNYCGDNGLYAHQIDEWHIGGKTYDAVDFIRDCIKGEGFEAYGRTALPYGGLARW